MTASSISADPASPATSGVARTRRLAVAWQHPSSRRIQPVGILAQDGERYIFHYVLNVNDVPDFSPFVSFPDLQKTYESTRLFPLFAQRVMDPRRPDFSRYVRTLDLTAEATPWEQLTRSEGRRAGDTIIVIPEPVVDSDGYTCCMFLVHGVRHALSENPEVEQSLVSLVPGEGLQLKGDSLNKVNPQAVCVADPRGVVLGWVPDLLLDYVHIVADSGSYDLVVQRVNGPEAPVHLRLLVRLSGSAPIGYKPFDGPKWAPIPH